MLTPDPEAVRPPRGHRDAPLDPALPGSSSLVPVAPDGAPPTGRSRAGLATAALVAVTAVWGSTFPIITAAVHRMPTADFLAVRFVVAALLLAVLLGRQALATSTRGRISGLVLGATYGLGQLLQTAGMAHCSPATSGFLTGLYVVLTPLLGAALLRHRIGRATWMAVGLSTLGLAVLGIDPGAGGFRFGLGEALVVSSSLMYALHILGLGAWARAEEAAGMAVWQMAAVAAVCLLGAAPGGWRMPPDGGVWATAIYTAAFAGAAALIVQTWAQAHLPASRAALVMTLEPLFAAAFSFAVGQDHLTASLALGGALILGAMLVVELSARRAPAPA